MLCYSAFIYFTYYIAMLNIMLGINYYDQLQYNYRFGLANYNNIATYQIHVSIDAVLKQSVIMKLAKIKYAYSI